MTRRCGRTGRVVLEVEAAEGGKLEPKLQANLAERVRRPVVRAAPAVLVLPLVPLVLLQPPVRAEEVAEEEDSDSAADAVR